MVQLTHAQELAELYNEIYRLQIRLGFTTIMGGSDEALKALSEKISVVREKVFPGQEVTDREIADAIWEYSVRNVRTNI